MMNVLYFFTALVAFNLSLQLFIFPHQRLFASLDGVHSDVGACIVISQNSGKILYQKRAFEPLYPASCTKIATLAYALSNPNLDLNRKITVPQEAVKVVKDLEKARDNFSHYPSYVQEATGTSARFQSGEIVTMRDALYGMMMISGNDAANTVAYHLGGGSIEKCVENINKFVAALGCKHTHFMNPHGLHHPEHLSSAYDLSLIALYGMKSQPLFRQIVSTINYTKAKTNKQPPVTWVQSNRLLRPGRFYYEYATGIKTGRHMRAQQNIVASGEKDGRAVIAVLMQCPDKFKLLQAAKQTLEHFLNEKKVQKTVFQEGMIRLTREIPGSDPLPLYVSTGYKYEAYPSEEPEIKVVADWRPLKLPIKKDDVVGSLIVLANGKEVASVDIYAAQEKKMTLASFLFQCSSFIQQDLPRFFSQFGWLILPCIAYCFFLLLKRKGSKSRRI